MTFIISGIQTAFRGRLSWILPADFLYKEIGMFNFYAVSLHLSLPPSFLAQSALDLFSV
jgi:hypothetical protein